MQQETGRMKIHRRLDDTHLARTSCAIGMFDGVHVGHRMVLENALREARLKNLTSVVFSFARHPQFLLSKTPTDQLSTLEERLSIFEDMGFDAALILDFDEKLKSMSALDFVKTILLRHLDVENVSVGYDHCFGAGRQGDGEFLSRCGREFGFNVQIIDPVRVQDQIVSSTLIRKLLKFGNLKQANMLLGRPYSLTGTVVKGVQRGRQLGFPTANLEIKPFRVIPAAGTYGGMAQIGGISYRAVCNIGLSPTFGDQTARRIEVHLLDYAGENFYGERLAMAFYRKLRDERKFSSVSDLIAQIRRDCDEVAHETLQDPTPFGSQDYGTPPH